MIEAVGADGRLLHADLRAAAGGGRGGRHGRAGRRPLAESSVRVVIVAGEPGGSIPATRERIEAQLGRAGHRSPRPDRDRTRQLRVLGAAGRPAPQRGRVHLRGARPVDAASRSPTASPASWCSPTSGGRQPGHPLPHRRHRRPPPERCACGRTLARLEGGILSRADDMVNIRGVNVYPGGDRSRGPPLRRGRRVPLDGAHGRVRCGRSTSRSSSAAGGRRTAAGAGRPARRRRRLREALGLTVPVARRRAGHAAAVRDEGAAVRRRDSATRARRAR